MSLQFVLTARFKSIKAPYGADIVYHFHRQISFVALAFILAHPLLLFIFSPSTLALLKFINPLAGARRRHRGAAVVGFDRRVVVAEEAEDRNIPAGASAWHPGYCSDGAGYHARSVGSPLSQHTF